MAGKNTSKSEHNSRIGGIVSEYSLPATILSSLSKALGVDIDSDKQYALEGLITNYRYISRLNADVSAQDIKRTLIAMSKLNDDEVLVAYENCDIHTEGHIHRQIYLISKEGVTPTLREAVLRALAREERANQKGGQPTKNFIMEFVVECLYMWSNWTAKPITCSHDDALRLYKNYDPLGIPSDTVEWCHILLQQVIGYGYDYRKLAKFISQNKGKVLSP